MRSFPQRGSVSLPLWLVPAVAAGFVATSAQAAIVTTPASDNATIRPGGPRTRASGKAFFNVEGDANAANASYGVIDFPAAGIAGATGGAPVCRWR